MNILRTAWSTKILMTFESETICFRTLVLFFKKGVDISRYTIKHVQFWFGVQNILVFSLFKKVKEFTISLQPDVQL